MTSIGEEEASLLLLDRQIAELHDRITTLRTVVAELANQEGDTSDLSRLQSDMCSSLKALQEFRIETQADLNKRG
jgi:hypothetical protein